MTRDEIQNLKALLVAMSLYYRDEIPDAALQLYVEDLADLPFQAVASALGQIRRDPKTRRCPLPADVRARITPESDPESEATMIAGRILAAIAGIGPYETARARESIGEVGWQVVIGSGGWENLCQIENDDIGTHRAQWRSHAKAILQQRGPNSPAHPMIAQGQREGGFTQIGDLFPSPQDVVRNIKKMGAL